MRRLRSFFLRDIALLYGLAPGKDRHLLQPVDTWIRFVVQHIGGQADLDDVKCAKYLVENVDEPEKANQGIWYFCVHVAESSQYRVLKCMERPELAWSMIRKHAGSLVQAGKAASGWVRDD